MTMDTELYALSATLGDYLKSRGLRLVTAESCTGGWIGQVVTATPGSSTWYEGGLIAYSNNAKEAMLGVAHPTLKRHGAVSEATVAEMVTGALAATHADVGVAVSGIAGPDGGSAEKPVGTICIAWGRTGDQPIAQTLHFSGDRDAVRRQTVVAALQGLMAQFG